MKVILSLLIIASISNIIINFIELKKNKLKKKMVKEIRDIKEGVQEENRREEVLQLILKIPFAKTQEQIDKTGNILNLNPLTYVGLKSILSVVFFITLLKRGLVLAVIGAIVAFFFIDIYQLMRKKNEINLIRLDLADVYNLIRFKVRAGSQIGAALAVAYTAARRSPRFKKELIKLAANINMTKRVETPLKGLKNKFDYPEIDKFVEAIEQSLETGLIEGSIEGKVEQVQQKNNAYIETEIEKIESKILPIGYLVVMGVIFLVFLSVFMILSNSVNGIFI